MSESSQPCVRNSSAGSSPPPQRAPHGLSRNLCAGRANRSILACDTWTAQAHPPLAPKPVSVKDAFGAEVSTWLGQTRWQTWSHVSCGSYLQQRNALFDFHVEWQPNLTLKPQRLCVITGRSSLMPTPDTDTKARRCSIYKVLRPVACPTRRLVTSAGRGKNENARLHGTPRHGMLRRSAPRRAAPHYTLPYHTSTHMSAHVSTHMPAKVKRSLEHRTFTQAPRARARALRRVALRRIASWRGVAWRAWRGVARVCGARCGAVRRGALRGDAWRGTRMRYGLSRFNPRSIQRGVIGSVF